MSYRRIIIGVVTAAALLTAGCGPSLLEKNWGRSVETARKSQTLNPQAGSDLTPVEGLDGQSAENALNTKNAAACDKGTAADSAKK